MTKTDLAVLEILNCIYEELDIGKIEEKFVELVSELFSFDRVALFFVKHKKEVLQGKLSKGFDPDVVRTIEIPIMEKSILIDPLISGMPIQSPLKSEDPYVTLLQLKNFAVIPIVNKKRVSCWEVKKCGSVDCPAFGKKWIRCWLISGTKCSSGADMTIAAKAEQCSRCSVYADLNFEAIEGVILLDNSLTGRPIERDSVFLLSVIAHSVGLAINNSKVYMRALDVAIRDSLTGLHNRRYFDERLREEVELASRYGERLSMIICDIDKFKKVNDTYGHPAGDSVLCWVANVLSGSVRKSDIVSRYGGEEFAILLARTDQAQAVELAEKMRAAFEARPFRYQGVEIRLTLSFGVSSLLHGSDDIEGFVSRADRALYRAKDQGRNRVCE